LDTGQVDDLACDVGIGKEVLAQPVGGFDLVAIEERGDLRT
jgi:hypothetical protein